MKKGLFIGILVAIIGLIIYLNYSTTSSSLSETIINREDFKYPEVGNYPSNNSFYQAYDRALQLFDLKLKEHDINTKAGKAHVIECGNLKGENLVLLHGMNATSTMWYPNIGALANDFHIYAIDFGLEPGKSKINNEISDMDDVAQWYNSIFKALNLDTLNLVGASRGGWLAIKIALTTDATIKKLALLSPAQSFVWIPPSKDLINNLSFTIKPKRDKLKDVLRSLSSNVENINQTYIDLFYLSAQQATLNKTVLDMQPFTSDEFSRLKMPVLLLIGDNDFINSPKSLEKARSSIQIVNAEMIPNAGHFLSMDQSDQVNNELLKFLKIN